MRFFRNIFVLSLIITIVGLFIISPRFKNSKESFTTRKAYRIYEQNDPEIYKEIEIYTPLEKEFYNLKEDCIFNTTCQLKPNNNSFFLYKN